MNPLLTPQLAAIMGNLDGQARRAHRLMAWRILLLIAFIPALGVALGVDYVLFSEVFAQIFPGDPGQTIQVNVAILALTGVTAVFASHPLWTAEPEGRAARLGATLARILLGAFVLGAGLLLAGLVYVNGADSLTTISGSGALGALADVFGDAAGGSIVRQIFEQLLLPQFVIAFACGLGGTFVLSMFLAHVLIGAIHRTFKSLLEDASRSRASGRLCRELRACDAEHAALQRKLAARAAVGRDARLRKAAEEIAAACAGALRPAEQLVAARRLARSGDDQPLLSWSALPPQLENLSVDELERRCNALRKCTAVGAVHAVLRRSAAEGGL